MRSFGYGPSENREFSRVGAKPLSTRPIGRGLAYYPTRALRGASDGGATGSRPFCFRRGSWLREEGQPHTTMKTTRRIALAFACAIAGHLTANVLAQSDSFAYQGHLLDQGIPANGHYELRFLLFDADLGGNQVGTTLTNAPVRVTDGLFAVVLDFGAFAFDGADRWVEMGVRTNGSPADFTTLSPRQPITATPYALFAAEAATVPPGAIANPQLAPESVASANLQSDSVTGAKIARNQVVRSLNGLTDDLTLVPGTNVTLTTSGNALQLSANIGRNWQLGGNAGTSAEDFLGTVDSRWLEFRVNNTRALRLEPTPISPNVILGFAGNSVLQGKVGSAIGGGGLNIAPQSVASDYGSIGGGRGNAIQQGSSHSTIGGGGGNNIHGGSYDSTVGGGWYNWIRGDAYSSTIAGGAGNNIRAGSAGSTIGGGRESTIGENAIRATIAGGFQNLNSAAQGTIGGGGNNTIQSKALNSVIAGGVFNTIDSEGGNSVIAGGVFNTNRGYDGVISGGTHNVIASGSVASSIGGGWINGIGENALTATISGGAFCAILDNAERATIGGGLSNTNASVFATIGGGVGNTIQTDANDSVIAGGASNTIHTNSPHSTIGGGVGIRIQTNSHASTVGGGLQNSIGSISFGSTIAGGSFNKIEADAERATIGGGIQNSIGSISFGSTISGGSFNKIEADAERATIGGGQANTNASKFGTIGGGGGNSIQSDANNSIIAGGAHSTIRSAAIDSAISGGWVNSIGSNSFSGVIGGGSFNTIEADSYASTIAGGRDNMIAANAYRASVGGGVANTNRSPDATIAGGSKNTIHTNAAGSAIAGGWANVAAGQYAMVLGGYENWATNDFTLAAGRRAKAVHQGAFVWADSTDADISSTEPNQFVARASGGVVFYSDPTAASGVYLPAGGGAFSTLSDRNAKANIVAVDGREVLERLVSVPVATWNYRTQDAATRHIGPIAQDFYAAFGVGEDNRHISSVDADGVALAAIQGLNDIVQDQRKQLEEKAATIHSLERRLERLESLISKTSE